MLVVHQMSTHIVRSGVTSEMVHELTPPPTKMFSDPKGLGED